MSGYWDLAVTLIVGIGALAWVLWQRRHPRIRAIDLIDAEQKRRTEWADEIGDPTRAQIDQALDVIAEPDRRRAEHMNRTLRLAEGGDEHG